MKYKEYGTNNPRVIIFLHGGGVGGWMWDKQIKHFQSTFHCIIPEFMSYTNDKSRTFTIDDTAIQIIEMLKINADNKPVTIVGFSLGAQIALSVLDKKPDIFSFAMINSASVIPVPFASILLKLMLFTLPLAKLKAFSSLQAKSMYMSPDHIDLYYDGSKNLNKSSFEQMMNQNITFTIPPSLTEADCVTLVTVGDKEIGSMKRSMDIIVKTMPNADGAVIPKIGHGFPLANPELFNSTLEKLMSTTAIRKLD